MDDNRFHHGQVAVVTRSITDHVFANGNKQTVMDTMNMLLDDFELSNSLKDTQKWDLIYDIVKYIFSFIPSQYWFELAYAWFIKFTIAEKKKLMPLVRE